MRYFTKPNNQLNIDYVLLKLDIVKAFDYLGWSFLLRFLQHMCFKPKFIPTIEATNTIVSFIVRTLPRLSRQAIHFAMLGETRMSLVSTLFSIGGRCPQLEAKKSNKL